jgi:hypothetical protein
MSEDNSEVPIEVNIQPRNGAPYAWTVEAIYEDGAIEQAIFIGPNAAERARGHVRQQYGKID